MSRLLATAIRFWMLREHLDKRLLLSFGLTSAAGGLVGALLHTSVTSSALPATASARCARSLSRAVPAKLTSTSVANDPNPANSAIWRLPKPLKVSANIPGITSVVRTARSAAAFDQVGRHAGKTPPIFHRGFSLLRENAPVPLDTSRESMG